VNTQLPLALKFPPDQRFDGFVGNEPVRDLVACIATGDLDDWLYLVGPAGSGKTHLLLAACAESQLRERRATYLPLASVVGRLSDVLDGLDQTTLVCLDGLEAIAGDRADETALFHFYNRARAANTLVIYAAQLPPNELPLVIPDLGSRLAQCVRLQLTAPDDEGRRQVLQQRAARRGLELDDAVLDFLFKRVGRDLATLTSLLDRLDKASLAAQRRITVPFLKQALDLS
jgi:DnaA family protein